MAAVTPAGLSQLDTLTGVELGQVLNLSISSEQLDKLLAEARADVAQLVADRGMDPSAATIPPIKLRRAVLDVAGDISAAEQAPAGVRAFAGADGGVIRVSLDNTRRARATLAAYLLPAHG